MDEFLSTREAADRLRVTRSTLMGWIYRGKIATTRRGRWYFLRVADVDARAADLRRSAT